MTFRLVVYGDPAHKERPRFVRASGRSYTPLRTKRAEETIRELATIYMNHERIKMLEGPLVLTVLAFFAKPKKTAYKEYPQVKPDWDNVGKLVSDALNGIAYRDDAHIVEAHVKKMWAPPGTKACTVIELETVQQETA